MLVVIHSRRRILWIKELTMHASSMRQRNVELRSQLARRVSAAPEGTEGVRLLTARDDDEAAAAAS